MKRAASIALVLLTSALVAVTAQESGDRQGILDIEQRLARAWVDGDRATVERILGTDWSVTDASGHVLSKAQVIEEAFSSQERRVVSMAIDNVSVRVFGDAAIATGRTRATGSYRGTAAVVELRFTDVFVRRDGRWQAVASHASAVAP